MFFISLYSLFFCFLITQIKSQEDNLHFVFEHFRHGARTPTKYKDTKTLTDIFNNTWDGNGELTQTGIIQQYILGLQNKERYKNFYNTNFDPREFLVYSTNLNRTLMSAQAHLAGMFSDQSIPLTEISNESYPPINVSVTLNGTMNYIPVPIHTYEERVIGGEKVIELTMNFDRDVNCPKIKELRDKNKSFPKLNTFIDAFNKNFSTVFKEHFNIQNKLDYSTIHHICDAYISNYFYNVSAVNLYGINKTEFLYICYDFETIKQFDVEQGNLSKDAGTISSSSTMRKMIMWMEERITVNNTAIVSYTKPKYVIYSAHDTTLSAMQRFLIDAFNINYIYPPYCSTMHFELRKYNDKFHVEYYFNLEMVLNVTFTEFKDKVLKTAWTDEDVYDYCVGTSKLEMTVLILGIILCTVLVTFIVLLCYFFNKGKGQTNGDLVKGVETSNPDRLQLPDDSV